MLDFGIDIASSYVYLDNLPLIELFYIHISNRAVALCHSKIGFTEREGEKTIVNTIPDNCTNSIGQ